MAIGCAILADKQQGKYDTTKTCHNRYVTGNLGGRPIDNHFAVTIDTLDGQESHVCGEKDSGLSMTISSAAKGI